MPRIRILAVASGGGHFMQLLRMRPAWSNCDTAYATTERGYRSRVGGARFYVVPDANRWKKLALVRCALHVLWIVLREHPDVVVSTGAAPGYLSLMFGRLFGARTIWVESIANAEQLSMSGRMAGRCAQLWLTQWRHLASTTGPRYEGAVL